MSWVHERAKRLRAMLFKHPVWCVTFIRDFGHFNYKVSRILNVPVEEVDLSMARRVIRREELERKEERQRREHKKKGGFEISEDLAENLEAALHAKPPEARPNPPVSDTELSKLFER